MSTQTPTGAIRPLHPTLEALLAELEAAAALAETLLTRGYDSETFAALWESLRGMNAAIGITWYRSFHDHDDDQAERYAVGITAERDGCTLTGDLTGQYGTIDEARRAADLIGADLDEVGHE